MFQNNLKIAFRGLLKQKSYTTINVAGLTVSLAIALLMILWVQDEWKKDKFHVNGNQIYRLKDKIPLENQEFNVTKGIPYPLLKAATESLPEVEKFIPLGRNFENTVQKDQLHFRAMGTYCNQAFFEAFSYPILQGELKQFDEKLNGIAISESLAKKFFGNEWQNLAIGSSIQVHEIGVMSIELVYQDFPTTSSIQNDFFYNLEHHLKRNPWAKRWSNTAMQGAVVLKTGTAPDALAQKIEKIYKSHQKGDLKKGVVIQKYADDYLYGNFDKQAQVAGGRIEYLQVFSIAAILLLLISCINFVNLATAKASKRAKEVGVRKTIGANRKSLFGQFMVEAGILTSCSVGLAILLAELLLPQVQLITGKMLSFDYSQSGFWIGILSIAALTTLLSGFYPSMILSAFRPIEALKGEKSSSTKSIGFRKGLVSFQFLLALLLVVGALIIEKQVDFIQNKNLGIDKENLLVIHQDGPIEKKYETLRNELVKKEGILKVTSAGPSPIHNRASTTDVNWAGKRPDQKNEAFNIIWTESDFLDFFDIPLSRGKFYRATQILDTKNIVLNEKAIDLMGMQDPVGKTITWWGEPRIIIGVVKDFNNQSLYDEIKPMAILLDAKDTGLVYIKAEAGKTKEAIASLAATFKTVVPEVPLHFDFVDEQYQARYKSEVLTGQLANYFAIIAIFVACLGLLGLVTFFAEQKTKEIGIRKVLGASIPNLIFFLSKEFMITVGIGLFIGIPISYYLLQSWLEKFAYKVDLTWWMFAIPALLAIFIAGLTISTQAIRAAVINPIQSLRSE